MLHESLIRCIVSRDGVQASKKLVCVALDVTSDESVTKAAAAVAVDIEQERARAGGSQGLVSAINCAGAGFNGPGEYIPIDIYKKQMDINFFGYVRVVQVRVSMSLEKKIHVFI